MIDVIKRNYKIFLIAIGIFVAIAAALLVFFWDAGSAENVEEIPYVPEIILEEPEEDEEEELPPSPPEGMAINSLTGLYICEIAAARRPFAVVYNNEARAMPQAGLLQADMIYEVLAEGVTTRLVAIFQDFDAEIIGPVRSSRNYMSQLAAGHGAFFVHHGASPTGYANIRDLGLTAFDGMRYEGSVFWRDATRRQRNGLEHSSVTSAQNLLEIAENRGLNDRVTQNSPNFNFFDELTNPQPANIAEIVRVAAHSAIFRFDEEKGVYYKYIFGNPQMDDNVNQQIYVSNVLIKITTINIIAGDAEGRRNVVVVGHGEGYLATAGGFSRVSWQRDDAHSPTRWFCENGHDLGLNKGRTWVSITNASPVFEHFEEE